MAASPSKAVSRNWLICSCPPRNLASPTTNASVPVPPASPLVSVSRKHTDSGSCPLRPRNSVERVVQVRAEPLADRERHSLSSKRSRSSSPGAGRLAPRFRARVDSSALLGAAGSRRAAQLVPHAGAGSARTSPAATESPDSAARSRAPVRAACPAVAAVQFIAAPPSAESRFSTRSAASRGASRRRSSLPSMGPTQEGQPLPQAQAEIAAPGLVDHAFA